MLLCPFTLLLSGDKDVRGACHDSSFFSLAVYLARCRGVVPARARARALLLQVAGHR